MMLMYLLAMLTPILHAPRAVLRMVRQVELRERVERLEVELAAERLEHLRLERDRDLWRKLHDELLTRARALQTKYEHLSARHLTVHARVAAALQESARGEEAPQAQACSAPAPTRSCA